MNNEYVVIFHVNENYQIPVEIKAENNELALNQAQGMINGDWISLLDTYGATVRVKTSSIFALRCEKIYHNE